MYLLQYYSTVGVFLFFRFLCEILIQIFGETDSEGFVSEMAGCVGDFLKCGSLDDFDSESTFLSHFGPEKTDFDRFCSGFAGLSVVCP